MMSIKWNSEGTYVTDNILFNTLDVYDASPEDLIKELYNLMYEYPKVIETVDYSKEAKEISYEYEYVTLDLRLGDYDDDKSIFIDSWRKPTIEERAEKEYKERRLVDFQKNWELQQLKELQKKYGKDV